MTYILTPEQIVELRVAVEAVNTEENRQKYREWREGQSSAAKKHVDMIYRWTVLRASKFPIFNGYQNEIPLFGKTEEEDYIDDVLKSIIEPL